MPQKTICDYLGRSCLHEQDCHRSNPTWHNFISTRSRRVAQQGRLCLSLGLRKRCTHKLSFLDLPEPVRARIYDLSGVPIDRQLDLSYRTIRCTEICYENGSEAPLYVEPQVSNLMLTCRRLYQEILERFYSRNHFSVSYPDRWTVGALRSLNIEALMAIRHFQVFLGHYRPELHIKQIMKEPGRFRDWISTVKNSMSLMDLPLLHFYLSYNPRDWSFRSSEWTISPLLTFREPLLHCGIEYMSSTRRQHQEIAELHAIRITGGPIKPKSSFRYLDLPYDIRYRILQYTDLIIPTQEAIWEAERGFHQRWSWVCSEFPSHLMDRYSQRKSCTSQIHHSCQFLNCNDTRHPFTGLQLCRRARTGYSTYNTCKCWLPPTYLFLVSRAFRDDAIGVFFSANKFTIVPNKQSSTGPLAFLYFLDRMPTEGLMSIRTIHIVIPHDDEAQDRDHRTDFTSRWRRTLSKYKDVLDLDALTLRVYLEDHTSRDCGSTSLLLSRRARDPGPVHTKRIQSQAILRFTPWKSNLRHFFVHFYWQPPGVLLKQEQTILSADGPDKGELTLERLVMGRSYDSSRLGKDNDGSHWIRYIPIAWLNAR